jgi:hypothetical protein
MKAKTFLINKVMQTFIVLQFNNIVETAKIKFHIPVTHTFFPIDFQMLFFHYDLVIFLWFVIEYFFLFQ